MIFRAAALPRGARFLSKEESPCFRRVLRRVATVRTHPVGQRHPLADGESIFPGDHGVRATPVSIPNTEVKPGAPMVLSQAGE